MSLREKPQGAAVFKPAADDKRPVYEIPVGGTVLAARWPVNMQSIGCSTLDVPREIVDMASKPRITKAQFVADPYHLPPSEMEPDVESRAEIDRRADELLAGRRKEAPGGRAAGD